LLKSELFNVRTLSLIALVVLLSGNVSAQDVTWKNYTIRDGLSHSNVYRIFQDRKGFLWFCTDYGLCSFDGRTFHADFKDSTGFLNTSVLSDSEGDDGNKIVCTVNGLLQFTQSFVRYYPGTKKEYPPRSYFYAKERADNLWAIAHYPGTSTRTLLRIDKSAATYREIFDADGERVVFNTLSAYKDELLFSSSNGLYSVRDTTVVHLFPELISETVIDAVKDKQGRYWAGLRDRVVVVKDGRKLMEFVLPDGQQVNDVFLDREDHLWIAISAGGLLKLADGKVQNVPGLASIGPVIINDIFQDFEGNIWLATYGSGLFMLHSTNILDHTSGNNIPNIYSKTLKLIDDRIWIGTIGNVYKLEDDRITRFPVAMLNPEHYTYFLNQVNDELYIGAAYGLIIKKLFPPYAERRLTPGVISGCKDAKGRLWFGGFKNIYQLIGDSLVEHPVSRLLPDKRINKLFEDSKGNIWCGTGYGAFVFHPDSANRVRHILEQQQITGDITEDNRQRIWLASTRGLTCLDKDRCRIFTKEDGLASTNVTALLPVGDVLWVGTSAGLNLIDLKTMQVKQLTPIIFRDVILSLCSKGRELYIGTTSRVYSIDMDEPAQNDSPPPVFITSVRTSGKELEWPKKLQLPYRENGLQIRFIGISYQAAHLVEYRYRIRGLDDEWRYTTNNLIEIPSLPPGDYTFILNARKNNGQWTKDVSMDIAVATPFWKTWWFICAAGAMLVACLLFLTRRHTMKAEERKRKKLVGYNKMIYLKQQALAALINPHFIFNCMNSIQHFLNENDSGSANEYMADFAQLIRMTLEGARETFLPLHQEIERIKLYLSLEQLRFENKLQFHIEVQPEVDVKQVRIPNMILQPYVENAIWHGIMPKEGTGTIDVRFSLMDEELLKITVDDDGVGIDEDPLHLTTIGKTHYGISLTRERLQLLRELSGQYYHIEISRRTDVLTGTRVEITVPTVPREDGLAGIEEGMGF
jgi:ligand-binding sensor domain-containing protein